MTRRRDRFGITIVHVDKMPGHSHLEGGFAEYSDAVAIRAIDDDTGSTSAWSTLPVRDGWVEAIWAELWLPPVWNQPTLGAFGHKSSPHHRPGRPSCEPVAGSGRH